MSREGDPGCGGCAIARPVAVVGLFGEWRGSVIMIDAPGMIQTAGQARGALRGSWPPIDAVRCGGIGWVWRRVRQ